MQQVDCGSAKVMRCLAAAAAAAELQAMRVLLEVGYK